MFYTFVILKLILKQSFFTLKTEILSIKKNNLWRTLLLNKIILILILVIPFTIYAQTVTTPQVNFLQRTSAATPTKKIYNVKGDFTMLGNTNLTLATYGDNIDNHKLHEVCRY
jgi:hypothetical protein